MTTELTTIENLDFEELARLTGADVRADAVYLPRVKVNRDAEDEDGNSLPTGSFSVNQEDKTVYGKEASLRLFINAYQYQEYSPSKNTFINRSIIIKGFNEQPLDELGGVACGKLSKDALERASADEKIRQKNIKCNRLMYGLLTLNDAKDAQKNSVEIVKLPIVLRLAGSNFMSPKEALDSITKMKHQFFQHNLALSTKREKQGSNVYYTILFTPDLKNEIKWSDSDMETFKLFQEIVDRENRVVMSRWKKVKEGAVNDLSNREVLKALDLNDDLPDNLM